VYGSAVGVTVFAGSQVVEDGGSAEGTTVNNGGDATVYDGGTLSGTVVDNGSITFDLSGTDTFAGALSGTGTLTVEGGGTLVMSGGDAFTGNVVISSGSTLELSSASAPGTGAIVFDPDNSDETLQIDGTAMPANVIKGFVQGDTIDLANVNYDKNGTAIVQSFGGGVQENILTITENGTSYNLQLDPSQVFAGEQIELVSDGDGGTDITVRPGLDFNLTLDQSQSILPPSFIQGIDAAAYYYEQNYTNLVTLNIDVGYGEVAGNSNDLVSDNGESNTYFGSVSYSTALNSLNNLPAIDPFPFNSILEMSYAEQQALGLMPANSSTLDGSVGFNTSLSGSGLTAVAEHELSEVMGRISFLNNTALFGLIGEYGVLDLFRYSAPGVPDTTVTPPAPYISAYFSTDAGNTVLDSFNVTQGADLGDWASSATNDAFLAIDGNPNAAMFTNIDTTVMNVLGWNSSENTMPCYCRGALIRTNRGQTRVERLKIGDLVKTASGAARPIKWIGRRSYSARFTLGQKQILPVCIRAGALADNVPRRDLWISPQHAMYLDGVLIEAKDLINGVSIVQVERLDKVEYFHIELDTHDVIIAEGAPSETFIDDDSRRMFHNAHEYHAMYPDYARAAPAVAARYCAPRVEDGYEVEAVRRRIAQRAGLWRRDEGPRIGPLRGYVDLVSPQRIAGWAQNADHPEAPVCLDVFVGGQLIGQTLANRYRADLERAGLGSGRHSFEFASPATDIFDSRRVEIRRSIDGAPLARSGFARTAPRPTWNGHVNLKPIPLRAAPARRKAAAK
jgi:autotransporter passenger strand-loop-strand repeat protein